MTNKKGICVYKQVCHTCNKVEIKERPHGCKAISCVHFEPCPSCKNNRTLHTLSTGERLCKKCLELKNPEALSELLKERQSNIKKELKLYDKKLNAKNKKKKKYLTLDVPGEPPGALTEEESHYYEERWKDYEGYYRSPTAYYICHLIVLEEIALNHINQELMEARGELRHEASIKRDHSISLLKKLKDQLPEKEADDASDDEKANNMLYDAYRAEKSNKMIAGISRMFSSEAIALAPVLPFQLNPREILKRMGYEIIEIEESIEKIRDHRQEILRIKEQDPESELEDITPDEILEFYGFSLKDRYALPYDIDKLEEEELEDVSGEINIPSEDS